MKPLTRREQAGVAVQRAMAGTFTPADDPLTYSDIEALKRQTEAAMNEKLGPLTGPTREQRRRLKQIQEGRLKVAEVKASTKRFVEPESEADQLAREEFLMRYLQPAVRAYAERQFERHDREWQELAEREARAKGPDVTGA